MKTKKEKAFLKLCKEISKCEICKNINFTPHLTEKNCFIPAPKSNKPNYVNLWNRFQGSLNADIMVIGQDYGVFEEKVFPTDSKLIELFNNPLGISIDKKNPHVFLTNIANCYRNHTSTGTLNKGCLALCANKFMSRLIKIISPKIIITLGQDTFNALACCDGAKIVCNNPYEQKLDSNFKTIIERDYSFILDGKQEIALFPVYHPGASGRRNRTDEEQFRDWEKIANYLKKGI